MDNQFKRRLANERRKWGAVVLLNVALLLVFPQRKSVLDVLPVQSVFRAVQPNKKIVTSFFAGDIEDSENSGQ